PHIRKPRMCGAPAPKISNLGHPPFGASGTACRSRSKDDQERVIHVAVWLVSCVRDGDVTRRREAKRTGERANSKIVATASQPLGSCRGLNLPVVGPISEANRMCDGSSRAAVAQRNSNLGVPEPVAACSKRGI